MKADALGIQIWVETHNEFATGKSLRMLLDDIGQDNCKVIWDVLHPLEDGEKPEETLKFLGKECVHVHIKDGQPFGDDIHHDWKYMFIGEGRVPIADIIQQLTDYGYTGFYSLEWETMWREELRVWGAEAEKIIPAYGDYMRSLWDEIKV